MHFVLANRQSVLVVILLALALLGIGLTLAQEPEATPEVSNATQPAATADSGSNALITALRHTHSLVRWLVVIITVVAIIKLGLGLVQNSAYDSLTGRVMIAFSGAITLQWVIGLVFLVAYGSVVGFGLRHFWEHLVVMTVAVTLAHMTNRWKTAADRLRYRNGLVIVVIVLALVFIGVTLLPQGWRVIPS